MSESKLKKVNEKIADTVVEGCKKIEDDVVVAYKKVGNAFVDKFLTHEKIRRGRQEESCKETGRS